MQGRFNSAYSAYSAESPGHTCHCTAPHPPVSVFPPRFPPATRTPSHDTVSPDSARALAVLEGYYFFCRYGELKKIGPSLLWTLEDTGVRHPA
jgi:hypothetical protein